MKFIAILAVIAPASIAGAFIQTPAPEKDTGTVVASPSGDNGIKLNFDQGLTSGNFEVANYGTISISNSSIVSNTRVNQTINVVVNGNIVNAPIVNSPGAKQSIIINNVSNVTIPSGVVPVTHKPFKMGAAYNATMPAAPSGNGTFYHPSLPFNGARRPEDQNSGSSSSKCSDSAICFPKPTSRSGSTSGSASGPESSFISGPNSGSTSGSTRGSTPGSASGSTSGSAPGSASGSTSGSASGSASGSTSGSASGSASGSTVKSGSAAASPQSGSNILPTFTGAAAKTSGSSKILLATIFAIGAYWM
ncbi:hypothetical protein NEOLI_001021 [Neolecta irregularis DAH-3]|uniref:Uncharacterized protein n=1 Tax=Neolecta irregularis (strain DAH-3) TaxID=1198029 RepID=A0A1U7LGM3_NEOID|nr:hypothetical protein NEOLI_001021 [Neolecta irregularis DAH-3]|eukprot:OLL21804.1 hypothetical protein NEOLI_001021 [Neolecta irregularis DAH-3]